MFTNVDTFLLEYQQQMKWDLWALWIILVLFAVVLVGNYLLFVTMYNMRRVPAQTESEGSWAPGKRSSEDTQFSAYLPEMRSAPVNESDTRELLISEDMRSIYKRSNVR